MNEPVSFDQWFAALMSHPHVLAYNNPLNLPADGDFRGALKFGWDAAMASRKRQPGGSALPDEEWHAVLMGNLLFYRKEAVIRQRAMADALGVGRSQIANIETLRSRITARQIALWIDACGVPIAEVWP